MKKFLGVAAFVLIVGSFAWLLANFDEPFEVRIWAGVIFACLLALGLMCWHWRDKYYPEPESEPEELKTAEPPVKVKRTERQMTGMQLLDTVVILVIGALGAMAQIIGNNGDHGRVGECGLWAAIAYVWLIRPAILRLVSRRRRIMRRQRPTRAPLYPRMPEA